MPGKPRPPSHSFIIVAFANSALIVSLCRVRPYADLRDLRTELFDRKAQEAYKLRLVWEYGSEMGVLAREF